MRRLMIATALALIACVPLAAQRGAAPAGPTMVIETLKGTIEIQLFRSESPKSVAHVLDLATHNFYRGQRIHRVEASLVQFGDPKSRDVSMREWWGRQGSGSPIGVAEFNKHKHIRGAVGLAHTGNAAYADSQLYICKAAMPSLDGKHVVIGQVLKGMEVVDRLQVADVLRNVTVRE
ncbi:MAG TPA: peptidylprolyl isomerase [Vicinamibacterales bacterium]|nr:peptidylprolyl isomerase [Vicinamibacterales bacterium]